MEDIKKIIAADETLQSSAAAIETRRANLIADTAAEKERIKRDLYAKADKEIATAMAKERKRAEAAWNSEVQKYKNIGVGLDALYREKRSEWARIIFDRVISGKD